MIREMKYLKGVATLELYQEKCTGCGMCQVVCPHRVFEVQGGLALISDRDACMECGACMRNCPEGAIMVQAGVGCAQAVINSALGRGGCCGFEGDGTGEPVCGPVNPDCGCEEATPRESRSGCC